MSRTAILGIIKKGFLQAYYPSYSDTKAGGSQVKVFPEIKSGKQEWWKNRSVMEHLLVMDKA